MFSFSWAKLGMLSTDALHSAFRWSQEQGIGKSATWQNNIFGKQSWKKPKGSISCFQQKWSRPTSQRSQAMCREFCAYFSAPGRLFSDRALLLDEAEKKVWMVDGWWQLSW